MASFYIPPRVIKKTLDQFVVYKPRPKALLTKYHNLIFCQIFDNFKSSRWGAFCLEGDVRQGKAGQGNENTRKLRTTSFAAIGHGAAEKNDEGKEQTKPKHLVLLTGCQILSLITPLTMRTILSASLSTAGVNAAAMITAANMYKTKVADAVQVMMSSYWREMMPQFCRATIDHTNTAQIAA